MMNKTINITTNIDMHPSRPTPHCSGQAPAQGGVWPPRSAAGRAGKFAQREGLSFRVSPALPPSAPEGR